MVAHRGCFPAGITEARDEVLGPDEAGVGVERTCVDGADRQRIERIVLEYGEQPARPGDTAKFAKPMDVRLMRDVVEHAGRERHVEGIVTCRNAFAGDQQAVRHAGASRGEVQAAL